MARKTISVEQVRLTANRALSVAEVLRVQEMNMGASGAKHYREGVAAVLESVLMESGNYKGFRFADGQQGKLDATIRHYH